MGNVLSEAFKLLLTFLIIIGSIGFNSVKCFYQTNNSDDFDLDRNVFLAENESQNNRRIGNLLKFVYMNDATSVIDNTINFSRGNNTNCSGTFKTLQTVITSPGYPNPYPANSYCEYTFRTPFVCTNEFHIQFLDFQIESTPNCIADRLQIGKREVLCGQVIGIMKYKAKDGILKIKFTSSNKSYSKGFKLLITRLPCLDPEASTVFPVYSPNSEMTTEILGLSTELFDSENATHNRPFSNSLLPPLEVSNDGTKQGRQYIPPGNNGVIAPGVNPDINGHNPPCNVNPSCLPNNPNAFPTNPSGNLPPSYDRPYYPNYNPTFHNGHNPNYFPPTHSHGPSYPNSNPPTYNYPNQGYPLDNGYLPPQNGYLPPSGPSSPPCHHPNNFPNNNFPNNNYPNNNYPIGINPPITVNPPININPPISGYPSTGVNPPTEIDPNEPHIVEITPVRLDIPEVNTTAETRPVAQQFPSAIPRCCINVFNQRRFYLSNPGFPKENPPIDCLYLIQRTNPGICRLRIEFRYFVLGHEDPQLGCFDNFIEIDGRRLCGCQTGLRYDSQWGFGPKIIRYRGNSVPGQGVRGMILDIIQEECPYRLTGIGNALNDGNWNRADSGPVLHRIASLTNSTTLNVYYYSFDGDESDVNEPNKRVNDSVDGRVERTNSRFFFPNFIGGDQNRCSFNFGQWLRLASDPMWLYRPVCVRY